MIVIFSILFLLSLSFTCYFSYIGYENIYVKLTTSILALAPFVLVSMDKGFISLPQFILASIITILIVLADYLITKSLLQGLITFALAHVGFIIFYSMMAKVFNPWSLIILVISAIIFYVVFKYTSEKNMIPAVGAYCIIISTMVILAFCTGNIIFIISAILFYISDVILGLHIFVTSPYWKYKQWMLLSNLIFYYAALYLWGVNLLWN